MVRLFDKWKKRNNQVRYTSKELSIPVSRLQGFTCSASIKGEWLNESRTIYGIYSYNTLMAAVFTDMKKVFINRNKYSVTTSKQMGSIRSALNTLDMLKDEVTAEELKELLQATDANARTWEWASPRA